MAEEDFGPLLFPARSSGARDEGWSGGGRDAWPGASEPPELAVLATGTSDPPLPGAAPCCARLLLQNTNTAAALFLIRPVAPRGKGTAAGSALAAVLVARWSPCPGPLEGDGKAPGWSRGWLRAVGPAPCPPLCFLTL